VKKRPIGKILVANRGEIAVRILRTCREMGIRTVAVYSEIDRTMPHVLMADEAYLLGPAPSRDSYLAIDKILKVAVQSRADAIHPGYGFLSEREEFARRVTEAGIVFIGPGAGAVHAMGDKTEARKLAASAGVPIVPGTPGPVESGEHAEAFCREAGFPVLIKAAAGGGGKGMRIVREIADIQSALKIAAAEALGAFGDSRLYLEKYLESPRHVEIQVLADLDGNTIHLGERECSIQRRHQKLIEESPSSALDDGLRRKMGETAVSVARACGYANAGTVEFLVDSTGAFYFLEMNTRLQVEHPVTEQRTGIDLVAAQIRIAGGDPLPWRQEDISFRGHAIECRICAEDPDNDYLPSTGRITHLNAPSGTGVREDRGIELGGEVSVYYDPLLSKLVCWGSTRDETIRRMIRALGEYQLQGVRTNIPLHLFVLEHPRFRSGHYDTHFLQEHFAPGKAPEFSEREYVAASAALAMERHAASKSGDRNAKSSNVPEADKWTMRRMDGMRG